MRAIKPLPGQCLVEVLPEVLSDGGIHLIDKGFHEGPCQCRKVRIKSIGQWPKTANGLAQLPEFKRGDCVLIGEHVGKPLTQEREKLRLVKQSEILAVLDCD